MKNLNIDIVTKITGLTAFVIRAWEKRYNVVSPARTSTNRRIYSETDVEKLRLLKKAVERGNSIRNVAGLSIDQLKDIVREDIPAETSSANSELHNPEDFVAKCLDAVKSLDHHTLEKHLFRSAVEFSHVVIIDGIILPLLKEIGNFWHQGSLRVAQEHMASAVIKTFLYSLKDNYKAAAGAPKVLITTPVGQQHEFGALVASILASMEGWDPVYLGPDLPATEIIASAEQIKPVVVALSIVFISDDRLVAKDLQNLQNLPEGTKLIVGGAGSYIYREIIENANGLVLPDFNAFREYIKTSAG